MSEFWRIVRRLQLQRPDLGGLQWRAEKYPQPEPKALRNVAWSLPVLAIVVSAHPVWSAFHNAAMLGVWLVGLSAGIVFVINLPWAVKQFIRR